MPRLIDNLYRFSIALGAFLFLLCSTATRVCTAGEYVQNAEMAHACCSNDTQASISSDQMHCCAEMSAAIPQRQQLQDCDCMTPSRPAAIGQNSLFTPDFIDSSHYFYFAHHESNAVFRNAAIRRLSLSLHDSSSRAPPHLVSL